MIRYISTYCVANSGSNMREGEFVNLVKKITHGISWILNLLDHTRDSANEIALGKTS